ncbi:MAG: hypothetical protein R3F46_03020 [bacterium]
MTDNADNWSRDISAELEVLNAYISEIVPKLGDDRYVTPPGNWRDNSDIQAGMDFVCIGERAVTYTRKTGALLAFKIGNSPCSHLRVPHGTTVRLNPSGLMLFDMMPMYEKFSILRIDNSGQTHAASPEFCRFVEECCSHARTPMICNLQIPDGNGHGLISVAETYVVDGKVARSNLVIWFRQVGDKYEIVDQARDPFWEFRNYRSYFMSGDRIVSCGIDYWPVDWIDSCTVSGPHFSSGYVNNFRFQLSEGFNGKLPAQMVTGVDDEYVYIMDTETARLSRLPVGKLPVQLD